MYRDCALVLLLLAVSLVSVGCQDTGPSQSEIEAEVEKTPAEKTVSDNETTFSEKHAIKFESAGKVEIFGKYLAPPKPGSPAVLLLHQWQSSRKAYDAFGEQMQGKGFAVLAIDGRGFGESVKTTDGETIPVSRDDEAVAAMKTDVAKAVEWLAKQPDIDPKRIGIVGASYGSSIGLMHAAENKDIKAMALLSPGLNYFGNMPTEPAIKSYGDRALLMVAAEDDKAATNTVKKLKEAGANDKYEVKIYPRGGHGTAMFVLKTGVEDLLEDFFKKNL